MRARYARARYCAVDGMVVRGRRLALRLNGSVQILRQARPWEAAGAGNHRRHGSIERAFEPLRRIHQARQ